MDIEERKDDKSSKMPQVLTIILTFMMVGMGYLLFTVEIPEKNENILYYLCGVVGAAWTTALAFWLGSSSSSAKKDKIIARKSSS